MHSSIQHIKKKTI